MVPSSPEVSERMARVRNRNTSAEMAVRRELHARGLRYRVNLAIPASGRSKPDIVFTRQKLAVFIDGCFWHRCPEHATAPKANADWWDEKLSRNVERDRATDSGLEEAGWSVLRFWEHEDPGTVADSIESALREERP